MRPKPYILLLIAFFALCSAYGGPQQRKFSKEEFKQKRAEYLKRELSLTPEEAARFLPLSEELMDKKFELFRESRETFRSIRSKSNVSDEEYERVVDTWLNNRIKEAAIEKEYYQKFKKVLPMRKVRKFQELDMKFMHDIMERHGGIDGEPSKR